MVYTDVHPIIHVYYILYLKLFIHKISTDMYCIVIITVYCTVYYYTICVWHLFVYESHSK